MPTIGRLPGRRRSASSAPRWYNIIVRLIRFVLESEHLPDASQYTTATRDSVGGYCSIQNEWWCGYRSTVLPFSTPPTIGPNLGLSGSKKRQEGSTGTVFRLIRNGFRPR